MADDRQGLDRLVDNREILTASVEPKRPKPIGIVGIDRHAAIEIGAPSRHHPGPRSPSSRFARSTAALARRMAAASLSSRAMRTARRAAMRSATRRARFLSDKSGLDIHQRRLRATK